MRCAYSICAILALLTSSWPARPALAQQPSATAPGTTVGYTVFLSGRPLWVNRHINAADAFVAAWLPGSEGDGVADVLFGKADFKGKLPFSWPADAKGAPLNVGDPDYKPLYPFGFGLKLADRAAAAALSVDPAIIVEQSLTLGFAPIADEENDDEPALEDDDTGDDSAAAID